MKISDKRKAGEILERGGISQRIITIARDIADGSYKNAIEKAGQIAMIVDAATYDDYWEGKASIGINRECNVFDGLIDGYCNREDCLIKVNPFDK